MNDMKDFPPPIWPEMEKIAAFFDNVAAIERQRDELLATLKAIVAVGESLTLEKLLHARAVIAKVEGR